MRGLRQTGCAGILRPGAPPILSQIVLIETATLYRSTHQPLVAGSDDTWFVLRPPPNCPRSAQFHVSLERLAER
jgi:hypothetical protein